MERFLFKKPSSQSLVRSGVYCGYSGFLIFEITAWTAAQVPSLSDLETHIKAVISFFQLNLTSFFHFASLFISFLCLLLNRSIEFLITGLLGVELKLFERAQGEAVLLLFLEVLFLQFAEAAETEGY